MNSKSTIVSLVPSLTETLIDLGLEDQLIGRTKFCIHPQGKVENIQQYGGTKNPHIDKLIALAPDLVVANKEENIKEHIEQLRAAGIKVLVTDIKDFESALAGLRQMGKAVEKVKETEVLISEITSAYAHINPTLKLRACYLIWKDPYMTIGKDTYIHDIMNRCGLINIYGHDTRYPVVTIEEIKSKKPDVILLSSEPFPFKDQDAEDLEKELGIKTVKVDGEAFSWYGSRMNKSVPYLQQLIINLQKDA